MSRFFTTSALMLTVIAGAHAQSQSALVKGVIINEKTQLPSQNTEVTIPKLGIMAFTDANGAFSISNIPYGSYDLVIGNAANNPAKVNIQIDAENVNLGELKVAINEDVAHYGSNQLPTVALEDNEAEGNDDGVSDQSVSGVLTASRDPFLQAAAFQFGNFRYQLRGYNRNQLEVYLNGLLMNDVEQGSAYWGLWGGLNDIFRNQSITFGLQPSEDGFGGLQGASSMNVNAANLQAQTRISYSRANRNYRNRIMATHNTGMMSNGWAVSMSVSRRWAQEGYLPGTFYDGYGYFLGLSKKINNKHALHFTTFGSPTQRGKAQGAMQEAMDLAGDNYYNPNWGWLNGEKFNSRVNNSYQPVSILNWEYTPNVNTIINMGIAYQTGYNKNSSLDWYNAMDPRPDYYRNLPSYYLEDPDGANTAMATEREEYLKNNPDKMQINWDRIFDANRMNILTTNGVTGARSVYIIGDDVEAYNKYSAFLNIKSKVSNHINLMGGFSAQAQTTENYREVNNLLGGDYYVNLNQFAERTYIGNDVFNQNNALKPNEIVREGDKYNYYYKNMFSKGFAWGQATLKYNKFDGFVAARAGLKTFQRNGLYKNGLFLDNSYGNSEVLKFGTYQVKAGINYKIDGRNYLYASGMMGTDAPTFDNTFISPRTRNLIVENPQLEQHLSVEGGYLLKTPSINGRLSAFATDISNTTDIKRFYHEDYRTFVNYVMQEVDMKMWGTEFALQAKISPSLSATLVGTFMQAFYNSRPNVSIIRDNDTNTAVESSIAYIKDYYLNVGPQTASTLGINYRSPKYWYGNINFNYVDRNYVSINPSRRTIEAIDGIEYKGELFNQIVDQEKLPSAFTVDVYLGKSFSLNKLNKKLFKYGTYLYVNVGVNNVLNNKNVLTGGYEQLRFDQTGRNPNRFANKYFYGYGANYFINISLKF
jgi:hypothetical protein